MNFLQRAISSVTRRKGKSIILFLVIFVLGNVIAGAIAIQQSTSNVEKDVKAKLGANATVEFDYDTFQKDHKDEDEATLVYPDNPKLDVYEKVGKLSYVKYFDYNTYSYFNSRKLKSFDYQSEENGDEGSTRITGNRGLEYFNLKGINYPKILDIEQKKISLVEGTVFSDKDVKDGASVAVVGKRFAEKNNLSLGDQLLITATNEDQLGFDSEGNEVEVKPEDIKSVDYPVKIIGFFEPVKSEKEPKKNSDEYYNQMNSSTELENTIYLPNKTVSEYSKKQNELMFSGDDTMEGDMGEYYSPAYILKNPGDTEAFKEEAEPLLPKYYVVRASSDQYDEIGGSMKKMGQISKYVVIISVIATLLIIGLVVLLFMRDRKHELGIYLSLGETRGKVMGQVLIELLIISALALVLSLVTGNLLGNMVSKSLMNSDLLQTTNDNMMYYSSVYDSVSSNLTADDVTGAYKVTFSVAYIFTYLLVGLGTVLLSALIPLMYILRLNPKKIMM
ncbi:ABC transporter permease [Enterococcus phoeniculicola]|uniref:ABC3 transporter permease C-terminal domain-containing protein n=1 Tax=Enterococcus phoeniculicola ATCC BAA-412 TaxID=1158610 RepID=R3WIG9_9ENTE|nr:ABC transporter permease [Enterococcus phoeniculicola]EOL47636.1 hypothetical protein UC3_00639 [Enterococcus phoeniculicola ATCC BAA-412]EOT72931.1 hypothetical protein I589_03202 [Enterococcus phoeniculicola ATCC BAA-412]